MTKNQLILPFSLYSSATHHEITSILFDQMLYLGFDNGMILQESQLLLISHLAPVSALHATNLRDHSSHRHQRVLMSGCHDGQLLLWANDGNLLRKTVVFPNIIKTIVSTDSHVIVGGYTHEIAVLDYSLQVIKRLNCSDWSMNLYIHNEQLLSVSFHGTVSFYKDYSLVKTIENTREDAHSFILLNNTEAIMLGKTTLSKVVVRDNDINIQHSYKLEDSDKFLYAGECSDKIIAWSHAKLFIFESNITLLHSLDIPSIFGGYIDNSVFYGIFKEKMATFQINLLDYSMNDIKQPLWNFTSDLYTSFEFIPPNKILFGTNQGQIKMTSILNLFTNEEFDFTIDAHQGRISALIVVPHSNLFISGGEDCRINFYDFKTKSLINSVACLGGEIIQFLLPTNDFSDLSNCIIAISEDNSLSIVSYKDFKVKFSFSGMLYPIVEVGWRSKESLMLITCRDGSTYCWSLSTSHLDRVLYDHSREVLDHCDAHFQVSWRKDLLSLDTSKVSAVPMSTSSDLKLLAHVLIVNTKNMIHDVHQGHLQSSVLKQPIKSHKQKNDSLSVSLTNWDVKPLSNVQQDMEILLAICSALVPWEVSSKLDELLLSIQLRPCSKKLTIGLIGIDNALCLLLPNNNGWNISGFLTAAKLLAIASTLKTIEFTTKHPHCAVIINEILICLPEILPGYIPPSLDFLLRYYNDSDDELRLASRFLFNKTMALMTREQLQAKLQEKLDIIDHLLKDPSVPITKAIARALFLLGVMHSEFDMEPSIIVPCLVHILECKAKDQYSARVAISDLLLSHYEFWAKYISKQLLLDSLFLMLTVTHKEEEEIMANSAQKALLHICFIDPLNFIKRLQSNLFSSKMIKEKMSILKLVITSISKDALFMKPLIPDIAYVVVKLLDPSTPHLREGLNEVIKNLLLAMVSRYPSVAFNSTSNKLAVGLDNGKIIVYDVSSGTKAYVLSVL